MISILIGTGFEETEAITVYDILKRGKLDVELISVTGSLEVSSARNLIITCDSLIDDKNVLKEKMIVIPGGMGGVKRIMTSPSAKEYIIKGFENNLYIGGICAGPLVLDKFKLLNGYRFTCYPGVEEDMVNTNVKDHYISDESIVIDRNLITSIGPGTASDFALKLLEILTSKEEADSVHGNWWGKRDEN